MTTAMLKPARTAAFTLVEIMVVVAVIGLLVAMAIPNFLRSRETARNSRYANDVRVATTAFLEYSFENGNYPPDTTPGVIPPGMEDYLKRMDWTGPDVLGGKWDWDYQQFGTKAGISSYRPTAAQSQLLHYDELMDNGDLETGGFRKRTDGYITMMEQ